MFVLHREKHLETIAFIIVIRLDGTRTHTHSLVCIVHRRTRMYEPALDDNNYYNTFIIYSYPFGAFVVGGTAR